MLRIISGRRLIITGRLAFIIVLISTLWILPSAMNSGSVSSCHFCHLCCSGNSEYEVTLGQKLDKYPPHRWTSQRK